RVEPADPRSVPPQLGLALVDRDDRASVRRELRRRVRAGGKRPGRSTRSEIPRHDLAAFESPEGDHSGPAWVEVRRGDRLARTCSQDDRGGRRRGLPEARGAVEARREQELSVRAEPCGTNRALVSAKGRDQLAVGWPDPCRVVTAPGGGR